MSCRVSNMSPGYWGVFARETAPETRVMVTYRVFEPLHRKCGYREPANRPSGRGAPSVMALGAGGTVRYIAPSVHDVRIHDESDD